MGRVLLHRSTQTHLFSAAVQNPCNNNLLIFIFKIHLTSFKKVRLTGLASFPSSLPPFPAALCSIVIIWSSQGDKKRHLSNIVKRCQAQTGSQSNRTVRTNLTVTPCYCGVASSSKSSLQTLVAQRINEPKVHKDCVNVSP